ncbi:nicotinate-nucleotide diphosphorylase (carboxylating) [Agaricicola taiwanensis]|uniref:Probable nicotinate-nucleotide pyrophosphorylase [carboxylating] n=1 Tax=Agaricicola taiwanensis TaxID=591372 RepID=A0A8J2YIQ7_9RHOB|nr:carboxylating nicotinate-nucleotide diphosphorylase [Agaricicola taiwanensis]GGE45033.1 nicotinate-nucleotide diphosphorylase (carboxylating) [Agaricicola taiwanensis]
MIPPLNPLLVRRAVEEALLEDLGRAGDVTTSATIPGDARATAVMAARGPGVIAGVDLAVAAFRALDPELSVTVHLNDGAAITRGDHVLTVAGNARAILTAERVALNFTGRLCGIASLTALYAAKVVGTQAHICCTRKTTPGLRVFEKYAVRCGGGMNHRFGLDDAVLIKDNHIAVAGGVAAALRGAKASVGHLVKIEIEVDTLDQLDQVLQEGADAVLLDNMTPDVLAEAVRRIDGRMVAEASGGVNLDTVAAIAGSGVDMISVGALTHSAPCLDLGLDIAIGK